jgi:thioredoxin 1
MGYIFTHLSHCHIGSKAIVASNLNSIYLYNKFKKGNIMALEITDANFEELVLKADKPVLIDFWAEWCGPCRMVGPVVEEIAKEYEGKAIVGKVNVDNNPGISMKFGIRNIPALLYFKNGEIVDKQIGAVPKSILAGKLTAQL